MLALIVLFVVLGLALRASSLPIVHQGVVYNSDGSATAIEDSSSLAAAAGKSETIEQIVDHLNSGLNETFTQRYFVNETQWDKASDAPVLLCVGGEGPPLDASVLGETCVHCTEMVHYSQQKKSLTFALEHRFYGSSMPTSDYSTKNMKGLLSSRQAAMDVGNFILQMQEKYQIPKETKWITFGGSYPGMMAAISHKEYPDVIYASVANSAPLEASVAMPGYNAIVGEAIQNELVGGSQECFNIVRDGHQEVKELLSSADGRRTLEKQFNVCGKQGALDDEFNQAIFAGMGVVYLPTQSNDPACTSKLCNIDKICSYLTTSEEDSSMNKLSALSLEMSSSCKFVSHAATVAAYTPVSSPSRVWLYQTCSEWGFYMTCEAGTTCPFATGLKNLEQNLDICEKAFSIDADAVNANIAAANERYGGLDFIADRTMFVNGEVDPWRSNSVQDIPKGATSDNEPTYLSMGASHHFWTHEFLPTDSELITNTRQAIFDQLDKWLQQ